MAQTEAQSETGRRRVSGPAGPAPYRPAFWIFTTGSATLLIPFGAVSDAMATVAALLIVATAILMVADLRRTPTPLAPLRPFWPAIAAYCGALAWAWAQALPLFGGAAPISLDPSASALWALRLAGYGGAFLVAALLCRQRGRAETLLRVLVAVGILEMAYAAIDHVFGLGWRLPNQDPKYYVYIANTFAHSNVFATFLGLTFLIAVALLHRPMLRKGDLARGWRLAIVRLLHFALERAAPLLIAAPILLLGLVLTESRGGAAATALALAAFLAALSLVRNRVTVLASTGALVVCAAVVLVLAGAGLTQRYAIAPQAAVERADIHQSAMEAIAGQPWRGTGLGTAALVLPEHIARRLGRGYDRPHNIYLGLALELGIPAAVALVFSVVWIAAVLVRRLKTARMIAHLPALGVAACVLVGTQSQVDDTLASPGVAWLFATILGVCAGVSTQADRRRKGLGAQASS